MYSVVYGGMSDVFVINHWPFRGALTTTNNRFELKRVAKLRAMKNSFPPPGYESNEGQFSFKMVIEKNPQGHV